MRSDKDEITITIGQMKRWSRTGARAWLAAGFGGTCLGLALAVPVDLVNWNWLAWHGAVVLGILIGAGLMFAAMTWEQVGHLRKARAEKAAEVPDNG